MLLYNVEGQADVAVCMLLYVHIFTNHIVDLCKQMLLHPVDVYHIVVKFSDVHMFQPQT
jgi:hypothetical protein